MAVQADIVNAEAQRVREVIYFLIKRMLKAVHKLSRKHLLLLSLNPQFPVQMFVATTAGEDFGRGRGGDNQLFRNILTEKA